MNQRRTVLITGASSGIGRATAIRFAADGWDVCLNARSAEQLQQVADGLAPGDHITCPGDYSDELLIAQIEATISDRWERLDALVNSAGISRAADLVHSPIAKWRECLDVMTMGAVHASRAAARLMNRGGRIIHVSSIHEQRAEIGSSSYAMAKAAIGALTRALALELAPQGILANAIAPGFIDTPMSRKDGVSELTTDWFRQNYVEGGHLPLRRAGLPEEIAGVAAFLAGPDATYITGQVITVDGGLTITF
jgi:3-oxoacyl-[acyl-carrier protein] reductase